MLKTKIDFIKFFYYLLHMSNRRKLPVLINNNVIFKECTCIINRSITLFKQIIQKYC